MRTIVWAAAIALLSQSALHAQEDAPRFALGPGLSIKGLVGVAEARLIGPLWLATRFTGSFVQVQRAAGARLDLISAADHAFYVQALAGDSWCYYALGGSAGSCIRPRQVRSGVTAGGGFEFSTATNDSWRLAFEGGVWRGFESDAVSKSLEHWFAAAVVKWRPR
jgi:hypothetical protein